MKKFIAPLLLVYALAFSANAQEHGFKFGQFSYKELEMKRYELDTSAAAVVLDEFGESYIQEYNDVVHLTFIHHQKIKILKTDGLDEGNLKISLYNNGTDESVLYSVQASTFNLVDKQAVETKFEKKNVINEKVNDHWSYRKLALPNVKIGSVIDIIYEIKTPFFLLNYHPWNFQSKLPKIRSEYWATIPNKYIYNVTMRGFLPLKTNVLENLNSCFTYNAMTTDCALYKFSMENIPAFIPEDFMTAESNFISAIHFELSEFRRFDGRLDKFTKEWKDVDDEMRKHEDFGGQLRKGPNVLSAALDTLLLNQTDELTKAKKIYAFIASWYNCNENESEYAELGLKKAFDTRKGNVGDINLSLVAALKYAGLSVDPMILSTRDNGVPIDLHPVITEFNYVIAKLNIGDKTYLLDATDDFVPFGMLPDKCLNGKGRVLAEKESYWHEIKPKDKDKIITMLDLKLGADGVLKGTVSRTFMGYAAIDERKSIYSFTTQDEFKKDYVNKWNKGSLSNFTLENVEDINKPIVEKMEIEIEAIDDMKAPTVFINPFIFDKVEKNPFKSEQRLYPVDYGTMVDRMLILTIELPESLQLAELPAKVGLALPNGGGRYIYDLQVNGNKIVLNNSLSIAKPVFTSDEYHFLKELYGRMVQTHNADLVLKHKP
jgi:hypothetical protein